MDLDSGGLEMVVNINVWEFPQLVGPQRRFAVRTCEPGDEGRSRLLGYLSMGVCCLSCFGGMTVGRYPLLNSPWIPSNESTL